MDLINALQLTQKNHEASFVDLNNQLCLYVQTVSTLTQENENLKLTLEAEKKVKIEIESERNDLQTRLHQNTETYKREFSLAKAHWDSVERQLKNTTEHIHTQIKQLEKHNTNLEHELVEARRKIKQLSEKDEVVEEENTTLRIRERDLQNELDKIKEEFQKYINQLDDLKVQLFKEMNAKDSIAEEAKTIKKTFTEQTNKISSLMDDKNSLLKTIEDLTQNLLRNKAIESEMKDIKFYINMLGKGNGTLNNKLEQLMSSIRKEEKSVGIQTELSHKELNEFENLDRDATILVIKMREELISMKDDLLKSKQENDTLKNFIRDAKRDRVLKEEEERVEKLEGTVRALTEMVKNQDQVQPTKEDVIIKKLAEVKKGLDYLKSSQSKESRNTDEIPQPTALPVKLTTFRNCRR